MQAIILAGGLGTRLKSVVTDKPKVLSPVANKPFLQFIINYLLNNQVNNFIFSLGYLSNQIIDFLKNNYPNLNYQIAKEDTPLGTGGGIKNAMQLVTEENVLIINADTFFEVSLASMMQFHLQHNAHCTIALKQMHHYDRYGTVMMNQQQSITSFKEKTFTPNGLINGGYLIFNKSFYLQTTKHIATPFSYEKDVLEKSLQVATIKGFISDGYFIDIGIPEDYLLAQEVFKNF